MSTFARAGRFAPVHATPSLIQSWLRQACRGSTFASFIAAVDLALVLQQTGERARAELLLSRASEFRRSLGDGVLKGSGFVDQSYGNYGIADARIAALRGRPAEALAQLRQAERRGWREGWRYYRDHDPAFATIRNEPEFKAVFADIERDMAQQRARLVARPKDAPIVNSATTKQQTGN